MRGNDLEVVLVQSDELQGFHDSRFRVVSWVARKAEGGVQERNTIIMLASLPLSSCRERQKAPYPLMRSTVAPQAMSLSSSRSKPRSR